MTPLLSRGKIGFLLLAIACGWVSGASAQVYTYDFDSLTPGGLAPGNGQVGQDGWDVLQTPPTVAVSPNGTNALTNSTSTTPNISRLSLFPAGTLNSSSQVLLTFDFYDDGTLSNNAAVIGLGSSYGSNSSAVVGEWAGAFGGRKENTTNNVLAIKSGGGNVVPVAGSWYRVQSLWDLSTGTATLAYENLTAGDTSFTPLYFDAAQTQSTFSLGLTTDPSTWTNLYVRVSQGNWGVSYLDNISVQVMAPEPSEWALLGIGIGALYLRLRRRRKGA